MNIAVILKALTTMITAVIIAAGSHLPQGVSMPWERIITCGTAVATKEAPQGKGKKGGAAKGGGKSSAKPAKAAKKAQPANSVKPAKKAKGANGAKPAAKGKGAKKGSKGKAQERTSKDVKREQQATTRDIKQTAAKLDENKRTTAQQLNRLGDLRARMAEQSKVISVNQAQAQALEGQIGSLTDSIAALRDHVERLRQSYAVVLKRFQGTERLTDKLTFIFAAETFNEAVARVRYMRRISHWRRRKSAELHEAVAQLDARQAQLTDLLRQKTFHIERLNTARAAVARDSEETGRIVAELQREGSDLSAHLERQRQRLAALDRELDRIIAAEQERRRLAEEKRRREEAEAAARRKREAEKAAQARAKSKTPGTAPAKGGKGSGKERVSAEKPQPEERESGPVTASVRPSKFAAMQGRLPFPVEGRYRIVSAFGRHPHPDIPSVEIDNSGIDIEMLSGSGRARAVADGTVSAVFRQPGYNTIVMVRHGEYLTIYAGLEDIAVKSGQDVAAGQTLGSVQADPENDGRRRLHFEVRRERQKLNPLQWVR